MKHAEELLLLSYFSCGVFVGGLLAPGVYWWQWAAIAVQAAVACAFVIHRLRRRRARGHE